MIKIIGLFSSQEITESIDSYINKKEYRFFSLSNTEKTVSHIETISPKLILFEHCLESDYRFSIFLELKNNVNTKDIPILLIDTSNPHNIDDFLKNNLDDFIRWPASSMEFNKRISNFMHCKINTEDIKIIVDKKTSELSEIQSVMIETLGTLAEYRDPETGGHIKRTQNYVKALAIELKKHLKYEKLLSDENIELIYLSVPLHDIGKVGIRDEILLKPGKLTTEEFEIMKMHTVFGHETLELAERKLKNNSFLRFANEVAYTHQEKWNGTGYPRGLKGEEIPLIGRIMALADVYDALISKRVYKRAMTHEEAKQIIVDGKGSHFDPDIVEAFLTVEETFKNIAFIYSDADYSAMIDNLKSKQTTKDIKNILLVEDSKLMLTIFSNELKSFGYNVILADDGDKAINIFMNYDDIDLVITDLDMPKITGYELVKLIRDSKKKDCESILVFALTAANFDLTKKEIKDFGFTDFMLKPLDINLLNVKISKYRK